MDGWIDAPILLLTWKRFCGTDNKTNAEQKIPFPSNDYCKRIILTITFEYHQIRALLHEPFMNQKTLIIIRLVPEWTQAKTHIDVIHRPNWMSIQINRNANHALMRSFGNCRDSINAFFGCASLIWLMGSFFSRFWCNLTKTSVNAFQCNGNDLMLLPYIIEAFLSVFGSYKMHFHTFF